VLATLGRFIAHRPGVIVATWILLTIAGFATALGVTGEGLFARLAASEPSVTGEADDGLNILDGASTTGPSITLIIKDATADDPAVADPIRRASADLLAIDGVAQVIDPFTFPGGPASPQAAGVIAKDRNGFLVTAVLALDLSKTTRNAALDDAQSRLLQLGDEIAAAVPGSSGQLGGGQLVFDAINGQVEKDLLNGEAIALPVSLLVMVLVFGGFLAAGVPIAGAIASIGGALAVLLGFSYLIDLDASVVNVVTVLGLGLCIDYGLLIVSRYREELRLHLDLVTTRSTKAARTDALVMTLRTAGRTVLFSGVTVAISLSGLLLFQANILRAIGAAGVSVVVVALLVALTLVPALIAMAGARMLQPGLLNRVPGLRVLTRKLGDVAPEEGFFSRLARRTQRRPWLVVTGVVLLLAVLAAPALNLQLRNSGVELLPPGAADRQFFDTLAQEYPASGIPAVQVVGQTSPEDMAGLAQDIRDLDGVELVTPPRAVGEQYATVSVFMTDPDPGSDTAKSVVATVRDNRPDYPIWVTGRTAGLVDFTDSLARDAPAALAVVILATFVLLFFMTGSLLIPIKALIMNVISLGASLGVLVWVFQDGNAESLLGFSSTGGIEGFIPILVFALGFGLAMDYEVFLLSRIKEFKDSGMSNDEAVVHGLQRSGRIITSAALIVVLVFAGFAVGELLVIKQTGVALAVAVAIDATIVRCLLVPATMTLLGDWNWWAPAPLRRLYEKVGLRH